MIKVTCNGCFDGLHYGHLFFLGYAKALGDKLFVGINSDVYIKKQKRPLPYFNQEKRKQALLSLGIVDEVIIFNEENPCKFIEKIKPDIHCVGEEYKGTAIEEKTVKQLGGKMCWVPRTNLWSSSKLSLIQRAMVEHFMENITDVR